MEKIYASLAAAGLTYDEGPDVGGDYGPYIQTQRRHLYLPYAQELVKRGGAYYCFCTKERLDEARAPAEKEGKTFKYDKHCLHLSPEEIQRRIEAGEPYVIRQNVPTEGKAGFEMCIRDRMASAVFTPAALAGSFLESMMPWRAAGSPHTAIGTFFSAGFFKHSTLA